jgi:C4-dicarboxylate transporter DctM subunit
MVLLFFILFLGAAFIGVPIAFALLIPGTIGMLVADIPIILAAQTVIGGLYSFILLAVPFFMLAGIVMNESKATDQLVNFVNIFIGRFRGGLAYVTVVVSMIFGGISGSSTAEIGAIGSVLIPAMKKNGYSVGDSVALTTVSSTLGIVIPPSIPMIIIGAVLNVSIASLFVGGIIPGILIGFSQMFIVYIKNKKYGLPRHERTSFKEFLNTGGYRALSVLGAPLIIVGGIISGWFTATEAGAVGAAYSLICGLLVIRTLEIRNLGKVFFDSIRLASLSLFCLATATMFGWFLAYYHLPEILKDLLFSYTTNRYVILAIINMLFLLVGCVLDAIPAIVIILPIVFPIAVATGIHPVHLGVVITMNLAIGLVTPPYGLCLLLATKIAGISIEKSFKGTLPYLAVMIGILFVATYLPPIVMFLPKLLLPKFVM